MGLRQYSREEGIQQGVPQGEALLLKRQLQRRFGPLPEWATEKLAQADQTSLETWADRVLEAGSLEEIFIEENVSNAAVFAPCDVEGFVEKINQLEPTYTDRAEFIRAYKRENIMGRMAEELLDIAGTVQR